MLRKFLLIALILVSFNSYAELSQIQTDSTINKKRLIPLTILLGAFGGHRIELGTNPKIPILYTVTLGGGFGILVVSDLIAIIVSKNPDKLKNNDKLIMWLE